MDQLKDQGVTDPTIIANVEKSLDHAEGLAAAYIRNNPDIDEATLNINNSPVCPWCNGKENKKDKGKGGIENILPPGKKLHVRTSSNGTPITYTGVQRARK